MPRGVARSIPSRAIACARSCAIADSDAIAERGGSVSRGSLKGGPAKFGMPRLIRPYNAIAACALVARFNEAFASRSGSRSRWAIQKQLTVRLPQKGVGHGRLDHFPGR